MTHEQIKKIAEREILESGYVNLQTQIELHKAITDVTDTEDCIL